MTPVLLRYAGARVAGQVAVVVALVSGLAGLAGGLEAAHQGFEVAVQVAMLRTPALLVALMPVLVATGAALAAARRLGRGEEVGLQACGAGPRQAAPGALIVGLGVGLLTFGIHGGVVPWTEARADRLVGAEGAPWVWVEDGAVRVADGLEVTVRGGEVLGVGPTTLDPAVMDARLEAQRPWRARLSLLWAEGSDTSRRELSTRLGRVGACGLLAVLGWLPLARRPRAQVGAGAFCGLVWLATDAAARSWSADGVGPASLAGLPALVLTVGILWFGWRRLSAPGSSARCRSGDPS